MLKNALLVVAAVLVVFVFAVGTRPATFHVERSTVVAAPPAAVFPFVNDYQARGAWYPWSTKDPAMTKTFSSPSHGKGSSFEWRGNADVGSGRQIMTDSRENQHIEEELHFLEPFPSEAKVTWLFHERDGGTKVTWAMDGNNTFIGKAMALATSMDERVGPDLELGLRGLKAQAEEAHLAQQADAAAKAAAEAAANADADVVDDVPSAP
jgi:hypothetical protein